MKVKSAKKFITCTLCMMLLLLNIIPINAIAETSNVSQVSNIDVADFVEFSNAVSSSVTNINLTADITFTSILTVPDNADITVSGENRLINASFSGNGKVTLDVDVVSLSTAGGVNIIAKKEISSESISAGVKASGSSKITVTANVSGFNGSNGIEVSDNADVIVTGDILGGSSNTSKGGNGAVISSGKLTVTGAIRAGNGATNGGNGIELTKGFLSVTGNINGGNTIQNENSSTTANGGIGLLYKDIMAHQF